MIWRREEDAHPLTIGRFTFTADARISVDYNLTTSECVLIIEQVRPSDEGLYHCQVSNSEYTHNVQLNVISEYSCSCRLCVFTALQLCIRGLAMSICLSVRLVVCLSNA